MLLYWGYIQCYAILNASEVMRGKDIHSTAAAPTRLSSARSLGRARRLKILFKIFARSNAASARCQVLAATWRLKFETNVDANSYIKTKKSWEIMQNMHAAWNQSLLQAKLNGKPIRSVFGLFRYLPWRQRPTCMKGASAQGRCKPAPFSFLWRRWHTVVPLPLPLPSSPCGTRVTLKDFQKSWVGVLNFDPELLCPTCR